jgi:hypothetical protein
MSDEWISDIVNRHKEIEKAEAAESQKTGIENAKFDALIGMFWKQIKESLAASVAEYNRLVQDARQNLQIQSVGAYGIRIDAPPTKSGRPDAIEVEVVPKAHILKCTEPHTSSRLGGMFGIGVYDDGLHLRRGDKMIPDSETSKAILERFFSRLQGL